MSDSRLNIHQTTHYASYENIARIFHEKSDMISKLAQNTNTVAIVDPARRELINFLVNSNSVTPDILGHLLTSTHNGMTGLQHLLACLSLRDQEGFIQIICKVNVEVNILEDLFFKAIKDQDEKSNSVKLARAGLANFLLHGACVTPRELAKYLTQGHACVSGLKRLIWCLSLAEKDLFVRIIAKASGDIMTLEGNKIWEDGIRKQINPHQSYPSFREFSIFGISVIEKLLEKIEKCSVREFDELTNYYHSMLAEDFSYVVSPKEYQILLRHCSYQGLENLSTLKGHVSYTHEHAAILDPNITVEDITHVEVFLLSTNLLHNVAKRNIETWMDKLGCFAFAAMLKDTTKTAQTYPVTDNPEHSLQENEYLSVSQQKELQSVFRFFISLMESPETTFRYNTKAFFEYIHDAMPVNFKCNNPKDFEIGIDIIQRVLNSLIKKPAAENQKHIDELTYVLGKLYYQEFLHCGRKNHPRHDDLKYRNKCYKKALSHWMKIESPKNISADDNFTMGQVMLGSAGILPQQHPATPFLRLRAYTYFKHAANKQHADSMDLTAIFEKNNFQEIKNLWEEGKKISFKPNTSLKNSFRSLFHTSQADMLLKLKNPPTQATGLKYIMDDIINILTQLQSSTPNLVPPVVWENVQWDLNAMTRLIDSFNPQAFSTKQMNESNYSPPLPLR